MELEEEVIDGGEGGEDGGMDGGEGTESGRGIHEVYGRGDII